MMGGERAGVAGGGETGWLVPPPLHPSPPPPSAKELGFTPNVLTDLQFGKITSEFWEVGRGGDRVGVQNDEGRSQCVWRRPTWKEQHVGRTGLGGFGLQLTGRSLI